MSSQFLMYRNRPKKYKQHIKRVAILEWMDPETGNSELTFFDRNYKVNHREFCVKMEDKNCDNSKLPIPMIDQVKDHINFVNELDIKDNESDSNKIENSKNQKTYILFPIGFISEHANFTMF